jgi:hypothetical protein
MNRMRKRRSTPAQRRAAQRLKAIGASLYPPRDAAGVATPTEAGAPTRAREAATTPGGGLGPLGALGRALSGGLDIPPVLAAADPLPALPTVPPVGLGQKLAEAIRRMRALGPAYPPGPPF